MARTRLICEASLTPILLPDVLDKAIKVGAWGVPVRGITLVAHYTVYFTEFAKSRLRFLLTFLALCAECAVLSGTIEAHRVVAGTLGEPLTRSRHCQSSRLFTGVLGHSVSFTTPFTSVFLEKSD